MRLYPPGQVTRYGSDRLLSAMEPLMIITSWDKQIEWYISGPMEPMPGVQEGAILVDGLEGMFPDFANIGHKGARQHGISYQRTVYEPGEMEMTVELTVPPTPQNPALAAANMRRVIRDWMATWDPRHPPTMKVVTPELGMWWCEPRLNRAPPNKQFRAQAHRLRQVYTWSIVNEYAFWRSVDSVSEFRIDYARAEDGFNRLDTESLGNQWVQTYTGPGEGTMGTQKRFGFRGLGCARWFIEGNNTRHVRNRFLGVNEVQIIDITGGADGGNFRLSFKGQVTTVLPWNATADQVEDALAALSTVGLGNVVVFGEAGGPYEVTWMGALGFTDQPMPVWMPEVNAVQTLTVLGGPSSGGYVVTALNNEQTTEIPRNANNTAIRLALEATPSIGVGDVIVTGSNPYQITFTGQYAAQPMPTFTATDTFDVGSVNIATTTPGIGLTGGSNPSITFGLKVTGTGGETATDLQVIDLHLGELFAANIFENGWLDIWGRWDGDDVNPTALRVRFGGGHAMFGDRIILSRFNNGIETPMKSVKMGLSVLWDEKWRFVVGSAENARQYKVYRNNFRALSHTEDDNMSALGPDYRGVGFGATAVYGQFTQGVPSTVDHFSFGDNISVAQEGHVTLTNFGTHEAPPRYLVYGPGTFHIGDGPESSTYIEFGPLADGQIALLSTLPRVRTVVDLSPEQPAQSLTGYQNFIDRLVRLAVNGNTPPMLDWFQSLFGIQPPQGELYHLLNGRFTNAIPGKPTAGPPVTANIPVKITGGNADSKIVAAVTPLRTWAE